MTSHTPSGPEMAELRAELRSITDEKTLQDDIEGSLESVRAKQDDETARGRRREDSETARKRAKEDAKRKARQEELCRREDVSLKSSGLFDGLERLMPSRPYE